MKSTISTDLIIIGAGLTGLTLASHLKEKNVDFKILESRSRVGGRIFTEGYTQNKPIELGATWLGKQHKHLLSFLDKKGIEVFPQEFGDKAYFEPISTSPPYLASIPPNPQPSYRIKGGTASLIRCLADELNEEQIGLSEPVVSLKFKKNSVEVQSEKELYLAKRVISTLPPNLLVNRIGFEPELSKEFLAIAKTTHTWMGESIKIALSFKEPFWRASTNSGTVLSNVGPISEFYDHCNCEQSFFALKGFFDGRYFSISKEERLEKVLMQLRKYYDAEIDNYIDYYEKVWRNELDTFYPYTDHVLPHQNNGHAAFHTSYYNGKLIIAGSETSSVFPGYMEGAIYSAMSTMKILDHKNDS
jgi:monoamine oxidase